METTPVCVIVNLHFYILSLISELVFIGDVVCCVALFGGKDCEVKNMCQKNMCMNGGVCQTVSESVFKCYCTPQFVGDRCEFSMGWLFSLF